MAADKHAPAGPLHSDPWTTASGQAARWIGVELDLRTPRTWFGPSWAVLGGIVSSGALAFDLRSLVILAVAWLVSEPLLASLAALSMAAARARRDCTLEPVPAGHWCLPYVQPDSPGRRLLDWLAGRVARLRWHWRATAGLGQRWLLLALMVVVLGAVLGGWAALVLGLTLVVLLLVAVGQPLRREAREGLAAGHLLVAWLLGHGACAAIDYRTSLVGLGFAAVWFAWTRRPPHLRGLVVTHVLLAGLMAALHAPLAAGGVLLLAVPLFVLLPENASNQGQRSYLQHTQVFLMGSLLLAAWGLVWPL